MNILITGGAGFIGSHLAEELLKKGDRVYIIDDLSTGSEENISHLKNHPNLIFVKDSVTNEIIMRKLIDTCDVVYHLAAAVGVKYIMENPLRSIETNVRGTEVVLELASKDRKKVLIASSSEVYGKNTSAVYTENADSIFGSSKTIRWNYAVSKMLDEFLSFAYHREKGVPTVIVRFFNICGPRQSERYGMVIPRFVKQALLGHPITIYGDGKQTRSFTHVNDAVRGIMALMESPEAEGDIFNVGNPDGISIEDLAKRIKTMTGSSSEIVYIPYEQAYGEGFEDMRFRVPDVTKIHNTVGYIPELKLEDMLRMVIEHTKHGMQQEVSSL
jgi:UDP-glucose 4-epimerase